MKSVKRFTVLIVLVVVLGSTACSFSQGNVSSGVKTATVLPTRTAVIKEIPTVAVTVTKTESVPSTVSTKTLISTATPGELSTTTVAVIATDTQVPRIWTDQQVGRFISYVGSWIFLDPALPTENDEVAKLLLEFTYDHKIGGFVGPFEEVVPDELCTWAYTRLGEGYGLVATTAEGVVIEEKTREERWIQFSYEVGDKNREPYCPQFDHALQVPDFGTPD